MLFATDDAISTSLYKTGKWDDHLLTLSGLFHSGIQSPVILDIGANLGAYSIPMAKSVSSTGGTVYAFEPQRLIYYQLCGNILLNSLDNVYAFNQAVGDYNGTIPMPEINYQTNNNIGAFSFNKSFREIHGIESSMSTGHTEVPIIRLDSMELQKSPCLIKIDVEGFELNVLKGAGNFLEQHGFPPILFEAWTTDWYTIEKKALFDFVTNLGYQITSFHVQDFVAQHPAHYAHIDIIAGNNGVVNLYRTR
jgi:FkbM family methyltransferase